MPHTDSIHVNKEAVAIGVLRKPVTFGEMGTQDDKVDVQLMFMLAIRKSDCQIDFLGEMIDALQAPGRLNSIRNAASPEEVVRLFKQYLRKIGNLKGSNRDEAHSARLRVGYMYVDGGQCQGDKSLGGPWPQGQIQNYSGEDRGGGRPIAKLRSVHFDKHSWRRSCGCPLVIGTKFLVGVGTEPIVDKICQILFEENKTA